MENIEESEYYKLLWSKKFTLQKDQPEAVFKVNLPYYDRPETASLLKTFNISVEHCTKEYIDKHVVAILTSKHVFENYGLHFYLVNMINYNPDTEISEWKHENHKLLDVPREDLSQQPKLSLYYNIAVVRYNKTKVHLIELKLFEDLDDGSKPVLI